jgi:hypothetical protein
MVLRGGIRGGTPIEVWVSVESRLGPAVTSAYDVLLGMGGGGIPREFDFSFRLRGGSAGGRGVLSCNNGDFD